MSSRSTQEFLASRPTYAQDVSKLQSFIDLAVDWQASHGIVLRAPHLDGSDAQWLKAALTPAPVALAPSPIPRAEFEKVVRLQPTLNQLFHRIANDHEFLVSTLESLGSADEFTARVFKMYLEQRKLGVEKPAVIGVHRSDYLIDAPTAEAGSVPRAKQVEFNTIAASFASLSSLVGDLHRHVHNREDTETVTGT
ncbi:Glutathione synthetase [Linderina macrospora]|uniref:Glutathione synthetase n=1 Tax=Linderina macrospora TaxID=4868 RepID=A0ACC1JGR6_9FUNG|nr:Glutathione synthetase [Linderina macrospora]